MRPGEVEGSDYFFVSKDQFERWLREDNLLEHALVYGEYKGIPRDQVILKNPKPFLKLNKSEAICSCRKVDRGDLQLALRAIHHCYRLSGL